MCCHQRVGQVCRSAEHHPQRHRGRKSSRCVDLRIDSIIYELVMLLIMPYEIIWNYIKYIALTINNMFIYRHLCRCVTGRFSWQIPVIKEARWTPKTRFLRIPEWWCNSTLLMSLSCIFVMQMKLYVLFIYIFIYIYIYIYIYLFTIYSTCMLYFIYGLRLPAPCVHTKQTFLDA